MKNKLFKLSGLTLLAVIAPLAEAHTVHDASGFMAGLVHPLLGIDHLLAILAAGIWAGRMGKQTTWRVPLAYMLAMSVAMVALVGISSVPYVETGIALSLLLFGLLAAASTRLSTLAGLMIISVFAAIHGAAHSVEMASTLSPLAYLSGIVLATALLQAVAITVGVINRHGVTRHIVTMVAATIAAAGGTLLLAS